MFHAHTPSLEESTCTPYANAFNTFGTAFDFSVHRCPAPKHTACASPNTDSIEDDLSSSSGAGGPQESLPVSFLPSADGTDAASRVVLRGHNAALGAAMTTTTVNTTATQVEGNPLFHFSTAAPVSSAAVLEDDDAQDDEDDDTTNAYDYAGLESMVMAAVSDSCENTMTDVHADSLLPKMTSAAELEAYLLRQHAQQPATSSHSASAQGARTTSPALSHGSGNGGAFLYPSQCANALLTLPPPRVVWSEADRSIVPAFSSPRPMSNINTNNRSSSGSSAGGTQSSTQAPNPSSTTVPAEAEARSNLFICGLPTSVTDAELLEIFGAYGKIESAKVMLDIHTGRSRGIAFVKYADVVDAENAIDTLNGSSLHGHPLTVRVANSRAAYLPGNPTNKAFVRNVPLAVSRTTLLEYFSKFGEVTDLSIKSDTAQGRHHSGSSDEASSEVRLNIVFITYATTAAAAKAAEATHTKAPFKECHGVPLLAKVAEDSNRRMERLTRRQNTAAEQKEVSTNVGVSHSSTGGASVSTGFHAGPASGVSGPAFSYAGEMALPAGVGMVPTMMGLPGMEGLSNRNFLAMAGSAPQPMSFLCEANSSAMYTPGTTASSGATLGPVHNGNSNTGSTSTFTVQAAAPASAAPSNFFFSTAPNQPQAPSAMYVAAANNAMQSPYHVLQPQFLQSGANGSPQGQMMYLQTADGTIVPVMCGGASAGAMMQSASMNPYYAMFNGQ